MGGLGRKRAGLGDPVEGPSERQPTRAAASGPEVGKGEPWRPLATCLNTPPLLHCLKGSPWGEGAGFRDSRASVL